MQLTLLEKEHLLDNIWAFRFKFSEPHTWTAGQYVHVKLPHDNADEEGEERWFTNSAAPFEEILQITTRVSNSTFKQALAGLEVGSQALQLLEEPEGDFVWEESDLPIVFIAGGIGVTPFRSIIKQRAHDGLPLNVTLVYGARNPEVPFREELAEWTSNNPGLQVHYAIGTPLNAESLNELVPNLNGSLVYMSGPEPMVEALGDDLKKHGLAEAQLKQDFFPNYNETNY